MEGGISWANHPAHLGGEVNMYDHGGGLAAGDFDGDGHEDVLLLSQCGPTGYYLGHGDGTFTDASSRMASLDDGIRVGVTYGDYDEDGDADFYVSFSRRPNALLRQNADGTFTDVAGDAGVAVDGTYSGVAFVDVDRDGDLDLVAAGTLRFTNDTLLPADASCPAHYEGLTVRELFSGSVPSEPTALFINGGAASSYQFTDEAAARGFPAGGSVDPRGFGDVLVSDLDRDGDPDVVLPEMFGGKTALLVNDGSGHFLDGASTLIPRASYGSPSGALADFDDDGYDDLYLVDMHSDMWVNASQSFSTIVPDVRYQGRAGPASGEGDAKAGPIYGNTLYLHTATGPFAESATGWGAETFQPWGALAADFDDDGDVDLFVPSGMSDPYDFWPNAFLENTAGRFQHREGDLGFDPPPEGRIDPAVRVNGQPYVSASRSAATADFDEDGALDLVVMNWNHRVHLFLNEGGPARHYLDVGLQGRAPHDPYGATVELTAGGKSLVRSLESSRGYLSQSTRWVHFGLGSATAISNVTVRWPDGTTSSVDAPGIDRRVTVVQP